MEEANRIIGLLMKLVIIFTEIEKVDPSIQRVIKLKSRKVDGKIQNKHNHPKQPWSTFNFFIDFLHVCPGGGPAQVFAHPHARQARPAPPLHRDLGLCHGLLNHANFSKLIPCQKKTSQELSIVGLWPRSMAWTWCPSERDLIKNCLGCDISCKHSTEKLDFQK